MRMLVTVGTTRFDQLVFKVAEIAKEENIDVFFQIADGDAPLYGKSFDFKENIDEYYTSVDIVITHAGAGSVYKLLENGVKTIVVPNLFRGDSHQLDLAKFLENQGCCFVAWSLDDIQGLIQKIKSTEFNKFEKDGFFKYREISEYLDDYLYTNRER